MPRRRKSGNPLALVEIGCSDRHRTSKAVTDQRGRFTNAAQQGEQQLLDVAGNAELMTIACRSPIQKKRSSAHARHCSGKRHLPVEIQNSWWVDERGNEDCDWSIAAMIPQAASPNA